MDDPQLYAQMLMGDSPDMHMGQDPGGMHQGGEAMERMPQDGMTDAQRRAILEAIERANRGDMFTIPPRGPVPMPQMPPQAPTVPMPQMPGRVPPNKLYQYLPYELPR